MRTQSFVTSLNRCARCYGDGHESVTFMLLTNPFVADGKVYTHWAPCPTNGEPILLSFDMEVS